MQTDMPRSDKPCFSLDRLYAGRYIRSSFTSPFPTLSGRSYMSGADRMLWLLLAIAVSWSNTAAEGPPAETKQVPPADVRPRVDSFGDLLPTGAMARLGTVRFRQGNTIHAVAISPDGKTIASAGYP